MRINNISLKNYRLLGDISVNLEDDITLIVGKNNTGKTSLLEVVKTLTSIDGKLTFEDFSQTSYIVFKECYKNIWKA
ncbi:MAG: AAA family ATPase [Bacteroidetes bacterium]|nr:AAA family ATPase [Bacteroidota bacterium]